MTNAFAIPAQKLIKSHISDPEIDALNKDIANAFKGITSFSKEVKKYMLQFIHKNYDDNKEVMEVIEVLKSWSKYESYNYLEIFQLQDECYFWYDFLNAYACWRIIEKDYGFYDEDTRLKVLIRLVKNDVSVFKDYPDKTKLA